MTTDVRIDRSRATDYETIFILRADIDADASERAISRAVNAIEQGGGKLLKLESWGKRRLAYPIGKQRKGFYVYVRYLGYRGLVAEVERNLRMLDSVIRYLTVKVDDNVDVTARPSEIDETSYDKAAQTAADEEDLFLSRGTDEALSTGDDDDEFTAEGFEDVPSAPEETKE